MSDGSTLTLGQRQRLFTKLLAELVTWAYERGYELTYGYTYRSPEENTRIGGHAKSLHCKRLAVDLNLFIDGEYRTDTESYQLMGAFWKELHPLCRWGGDFQEPKKRDGNHFSITHEGIS